MYYEITCLATEKINDLQDEFWNAESEIEMVARDEILASLGFKLQLWKSLLPLETGSFFTHHCNG